jgi:hypothetical protein
VGTYSTIRIIIQEGAVSRIILIIGMMSATY